jgi:hypothetical protein
MSLVSCLKNRSSPIPDRRSSVIRMVDTPLVTSGSNAKPQDYYGSTSLNRALAEMLKIYA